MIDGGSSRQPALRDWLALIGVYAGLFAVISGLEAAAYGVDLVRRCYAKNGVELVALSVLCAGVILIPTLLLSPQRWRWAMLALAFIGCDWAVRSSFPHLGPFRVYFWNWQGRIVTLLGIAGFLALGNSLTLSEVGITSRLRKGWWRPLLAYAALAAAVWVFYHRCGRPIWHPQTFWFQATMPGLAEELALRGVLLAMLTRAIAPRREPDETSVIGPAIVSSLVFGITHIIDVSPELGLTIRWARMHTAAGGLLFWWIRHRTGSVWPAVVVHNLANLQLMADYETWS